MKRTFKNVLCLLAVGAIAVSCEKNGGNDSATTIEELKAVVFEEEAPVEISSKKTGNIATNPTTGKNQYEYLTTVQKQYLVAPLSIVSETMTDVIYPGSMLRGDSFVQGNYDPLVLRNEYNPVNLSLTLRGDISVSESVKPALSQVRSTMNDLIARQKEKVDYSFVPSVFNYESNEITTTESFKRSFKIHAKAKVLSGLVKAKFSFEENQSSSNQKRYVMVSFRQFLYNASVDPQHYSSWIQGDIDVSDMGGYEPLYISSVDYGRVGYILVETEKSTEEMSKMIKASLEVAVQYANVESSTKLSKEFQKMFEQNKVQVMISGGPLELGNQVNSYESFVKFVQMPTAENLTKTSVPIAYKVRRVKDNTEVQVLDTFTENIFQLKDN
ncbi:MAG: thiol-activated cytolysin family protein [Capnocytophaga sp.]|nr:thiol-activated cytolysin family protein [Capnocytophaga sp.]